MTTKPTVGRIVHVHLIAPGGPNKDKVVTRPATITQVWSDTCVNVRVQLDGWNDLGDAYKDFAAVSDAEWKTSVCLLAEGAEPSNLTWSWPPRA